LLRGDDFLHGRSFYRLLRGRLLGGRFGSGLGGRFGSGLDDCFGSVLNGWFLDGCFGSVLDGFFLDRHFFPPFGSDVRTCC
jgi:hypothetical protein